MTNVLFETVYREFFVDAYIPVDNKHIKEKFSQIEKEMLIVMEEYVSRRDELEKKYKEEVDKFQKRIKDLQLECPHNVQSRYQNLKKTRVLQRGKAFAILCAVKENGKVNIGWSYLNPEDKRFNRKIGKQIAYNTAMGIYDPIVTTTKIFDKTSKMHMNVNVTIPIDRDRNMNKRLHNALQLFALRASKYFRTEVNFMKRANQSV